MSRLGKFPAPDPWFHPRTTHLKRRACRLASAVGHHHVVFRTALSIPRHGFASAIVLNAA